MSETWIIILAVGIPLLVTAIILTIVFSFIIRATNRYRRLLLHGVAAQATILNMWDTNVRVNNKPRVGFLLEVRPSTGEPPFSAEAKKIVSLFEIPQYQRGALLEVFYDPTDRTKIAIAGAVGTQNGIQR